MKKISYQNKTKEELNVELKSLQAVVRSAIAKPSMGKNNKEYTTARKNIARVMTALNSETLKASTEVKK